MEPGGPGGFTEYVLSKYAYVEGACITGFGMSLAIPAEADRSYTSLNWSLSHLHCPPVISITGNNVFVYYLNTIVCGCVEDM